MRSIFKRDNDNRSTFDFTLFHRQVFGYRDFLIEVLNLIGIFKVFVILAMLLQMKYTRNHCYSKELYFIYTFFRYIS